MKNKEVKNYWKKLKFRYRLSAINENTLEEVWRVKTSIFSGIMLVLFLSLLLVFVTASFIIATPIRYYLPGYMDAEIRDKSVQTAIKMDSLEQALLLNDEYIKNIKAVMTGEVPVEYVAKLDSAKLILENDSRLGKSDIEKSFVEKYEDEEKYTLGVFQPNNTATTIFFNKPVKAAVVEKFDVTKDRYGVVLGVTSSEPVLGSAEGTIVYIGYDTDNKKIVQIQHKNGYISIYKGLTDVTKKIGDTIKPSEAIGFIKVDPKETDSNNFLVYELWNKGLPVDPEQYILF